MKHSQKFHNHYLDSSTPSWQSFVSVALSSGGFYIIKYGI